MTVDLSMAYLLMLVPMTLTLTQGHNGSANANIQSWIISTTKQATSINLATTVAHFALRELDFKDVHMAWPPGLPLRLLLPYKQPNVRRRTRTCWPSGQFVFWEWGVAEPGPNHSMCSLAWHGRACNMLYIYIFIVMELLRQGQLESDQSVECERDDRYQASPGYTDTEISCFTI